MEFNNTNFVALISKDAFDNLLKVSAPIEIVIGRLLTNICLQLNFMNTRCVIYESSYGEKSFLNWFRKEYIIEEARIIAKKQGIKLELNNNTSIDIIIAEGILKQKIEQLEKIGKAFTHTINY